MFTWDSNVDRIFVCLICKQNLYGYLEPSMHTMIIATVATTATTTTTTTTTPPTTTIDQ